jgi:CHAT domain-containing protein
MGADRLLLSGSPPQSEVRLPGGGRLYGTGIGGSISSDLVAALKKVPESANAERERLRAVYEATQSNWAQASQFLDRAARSGMAASIVTNDKAVVALAAATTEHDLLGRVTALSLLDQAVREDPHSEIAWYNRAVVLEQLQLPLSAATAWRRYLAAGGLSPYLEEARRRFRRLMAARSPTSCWNRTARWREWLAAPQINSGPYIEGEDIQAVRLFLEDELLPAWAEALTRGEEARARILAKNAFSLAQGIIAQSGDPMVFEIVERAIAAEIPGARAVLAYRRGRAAFRSLRYEDCIQDLTEAERLLDNLRNPASLRARAYRSACLAHSMRQAEAGAELRVLMTSKYPSIRAHAAEQLGAILSSRGMPAQALPFFHKAETLFAEHHELASLGIVQGEIADSLFSLGEIEIAWQMMEEALRTSARSCNAYAHGANVWTAGDLLLRAGALEAAAAFQRESLAMERSGGDAALIAESLRTIALNEARLKRVDEAISVVREARALLGKIPSRSVQETQMGFLDWIEGTAISDRDPTRASQLLGQALPCLERLGRDSERTAALLARGRALLAAGDREAGRANLRRGIEAYERLREHVSAVTDPARAFAEAEPAFDALTASLLTDGWVAEALANSERGRRPFGDDSESECLPVSTSSKVGTLYFDQMDEQLVVWWLLAGRLEHWTIGWSRQTTRRRVSELSDLRDDRLGQFASELLAPIAANLATLDRIVVVAEDALAMAPWNAMPHTKMGHWVDHLVVTVAPSLTVARRGGRRVMAPEALIVADTEPADDRGLRLPPLPAAREEGQSVAASYPGATLLVGERATRARVLSRWASADVVHFAVHTVVDDTFPGTARLVLSSRGDDIGHLTATDVAATSFDRQPLVVLSACSTRAGRLLPLAGPMDLVREFLAAGAVGVIATLRPIDDRLTAELMTAFHREYALHADGAVSLSLAIRAIRRRDPRRREWAAFQYVGGQGGMMGVNCR